MQAEKFWNSLTEEERELAFLAVVSLIFKAEVNRRGTFRHSLYDVFKFNKSMYGPAMDAGYMTIHNLIAEGLNHV